MEKAGYKSRLSQSPSSQFPIYLSEINQRGECVTGRVGERSGPAPREPPGVLNSHNVGARKCFKARNYWSVWKTGSERVKSPDR